ncbi:hypothetical protein [Neptuniibacter sp. QD37_11]|uniref:hypothetical protein n=1 Tax=Neptuniibacter sp. QD37_11 TaxID=3398209 RepID=UPI0039F4A764
MNFVTKIRRVKPSSPGKAALGAAALYLLVVGLSGMEQRGIVLAPAHEIEEQGHKLSATGGYAYDPQEVASTYDIQMMAKTVERLGSPALKRVLERALSDSVITRDEYEQFALLVRAGKKF